MNEDFFTMRFRWLVCLIVNIQNCSQTNLMIVFVRKYFAVFSKDMMISSFIYCKSALILGHIELYWSQCGWIFIFIFFLLQTGQIFIAAWRFVALILTGVISNTCRLRIFTGFWIPRRDCPLLGIRRSCFCAGHSHVWIYLGERSSHIIKFPWRPDVSVIGLCVRISNPKIDNIRFKQHLHRSKKNLSGIFHGFHLVCGYKLRDRCHGWGQRSVSTYWSRSTNW